MRDAALVPERRAMPPVQVVATGLEWPEGPVARQDGSVLITECARGVVSHVGPDGVAALFAQCGGGPAGLAVGPDGAIYVCNGGGTWFRDLDGLLQPWGASADYVAGRIERIDPTTGAVRVLYSACDGRPLSSPNDIVFDQDGGFWFTDLGKTRGRTRDFGAVYYARPDGSHITQAIFPLDTPNGIGLSPDGSILYVAETITARLWAFDITAPGTVRAADSRWRKGRLMVGLPGLAAFDSLAVQADGAVCVATLLDGGITRVSADGTRAEHIALPDTYVTNLCFGGPGLRTAFVTLSSKRQLVTLAWDAAGLKPHFSGLP